MASLEQVWETVRTTLLDDLSSSPAVRVVVPAVEEAVSRGELAPSEAAARILAAFHR